MKRIVAVIFFLSFFDTKSLEVNTYFLAALGESDKPELAAYLINALPAEKRTRAIQNYNAAFPDAPYQTSRYLSSEINQALQNLREKNAQLESRVAEQQDQISTLKRENADIQQQVLQLQTHVENENAVKEELRKQLTTATEATAQLGELQKQNETTTQQKIDLQNQIGILEKERNNLGKESEALKAQLETEKNERAKEQEAFKQEKAQLTTRIEELQKEIGKSSTFAHTIAQQRDKNPWQLAENFFMQEGQPGTQFIDTLAQFKQEAGAQKVAESLIAQLQTKVINPSEVD